MLALTYYAGARLGFLLQSPVVPQSILWLPNSILLSALIVTSPLRWPALLLAAFPAQMLVALQSHSPPITMAVIFLTNCGDAALGAAIWQFLAPAKKRVEGLRSMLIFLVLCATLPTVLLSFADAAITSAMHWSRDYWLAFVTRARANVLTNIIFVPAAVAILTSDRNSFMAAVRSRWSEGIVLLLGLVISAEVAFRQPNDSFGLAALAYLPLFFIVWAAVRFGIAMTGVSLLTLAFMTALKMIHAAGGYYAGHVAGALVPALQYQLLAIAVPVMCVCAVIQDRERATRALAASQEALNQSLAQIRTLAGRLLSATEIERTRIARDLHDDINQQIAALGIGLSALKRRLPNDLAIRAEVASLQGQAMRVADAVRSLSHELHPAALQHAGLVPALRELCAQYGTESSMRAILDAQDDVSVAPDIALCVYRVSQEALRNAARHSGARTARVELRTRGEALELRVEDEGRGFDDTARRRGGLGLTSMTERVRLVGGMVQVDSSPGRGTRVELRVPYRHYHGSPDATAR